MSIHLRSPFTGRTACPVKSPQAVAEDPYASDCSACKTKLAEVIDESGHAWQIPGKRRRYGYAYKEMREAYSAGLLRGYAPAPSLADGGVPVWSESMTPVSAKEEDLVQLAGIVARMAISGVRRDRLIQQLTKRVVALEGRAAAEGTPSSPLGATESVQNSEPSPEVGRVEKIAQGRAQRADGALAYWPNGLERYYQVGDIVIIEPKINNMDRFAVVVQVRATDVRLRSLAGSSARHWVVPLAGIRLASVGIADGFDTAVVFAS